MSVKDVVIKFVLICGFITWLSTSVVSYFRLSMALLYISEWYLSISSWVTEIDASFSGVAETGDTNGMEKGRRGPHPQRKELYCCRPISSHLPLEC